MKLLSIQFSSASHQFLHLLSTLFLNMCVNKAHHKKHICHPLNLSIHPSTHKPSHYSHSTAIITLSFTCKVHYYSQL
jgi:hypothetical protein